MNLALGAVNCGAELTRLISTMDLGADVVRFPANV